MHRNLGVQKLIAGEAKANKQVRSGTVTTGIKIYPIQKEVIFGRGRCI